MPDLTEIFTFTKSRTYVKDFRIGRPHQLLYENKFKNIHHPLINSDVINEKYFLSTIKGDYIYFHYRQDGMNDEGWGCAYRSLQTLFSWFILQGFTDKKVPTIYEIQQILVSIGDKSESFLGSSQWIGSFEVSYVLNTLLGIDSKTLNISSGKEIIGKVHEFKSHFDNFGTPIMIGGGVLAYTLLGIAINEENLEESQFLILDPHYIGPEDNKKILDKKKGGVWWKGTKIFLPNAFYNFCCPIPQLT